MLAGKTIAFLIWFEKSLPSIHVRAKCLKDFAPHGYTFEFIEGSYPALLNYPVGRGLYRYFFYLSQLATLKYVKHKKVVALINKPPSILLILIIRHMLRIPVIVDINDPIHLPEYYGYAKTSLILKFSNYIIFESPEYSDYWKKRKISLFSVIEDTPQIECIFINYEQRLKQVIWVGSPATSQDLLEFIPHFLLFNKFGFNIKLLGASSNVVQILLNSNIDLTPVYTYDSKSLIDELSLSAVAFVPMPNSDKYNFRGNLKAKISMGCGCLTIATANKMHERLISNKQTGYLFNTYEDLNSILAFISGEVKVAISIAYNGNEYVANNFTRAFHAKEVCKIADKLCE